MCAAQPAYGLKEGVMFPHKSLFLTLLSLLLLAAVPALALEYTGRVVGISDGDTLPLADAGQAANSGAPR